ncbi:hypothetical protein CCACVL1_14239 [Corchorus capsularis]|uniref:Uncharacterized protein n=1 Tax=Corchorus capsularis TaxID=210143 RepID=A0A1R3I7S6_COCAP|nr:hypothetical protein CCACVL1_14239 [Corchorus capsularis]
MEEVKDGEGNNNTTSIDDNINDNEVAKAASNQGRISGPTRRSTKGGWTEEEDKMLTIAVQKFNGKSWKKIAECVPDRTDVQCLHRWQKVLNPNLIKGPWSKEEDDLIFELVQKQGKTRWSEIAKYLPGRIGKQCRERWCNHLNPDIKKSAWTEEEELMLIRAHGTYGNRWAEIAKLLPGRTENSIKNHWNCSVRKKAELLAASGINLGNGQGITSTNPYIAVGNSNSFGDYVRFPFLHERTTEQYGLANKMLSEPQPLLPNAALPGFVERLSNSSVRPQDTNGTGNTEYMELTGRTPDSFDSDQPVIVNTNSCPESILRNAAKSFRNTPSIIRKRSCQTTRETSSNHN